MLSEKEIRIVGALQKELPLEPEPYRALAKELSMTEEELLAGMKALAEKGCLKRIAAALRHNNVGYTINSMIVWDVPEGRVDEAGRALARQPQVTHCYDRNRQPGFDYNLYSMVHARSEEEYGELLGELIEVVRPVKYEELRTVAELKKTGMRYFPSKVEEEFFRL
ncbi:siroheme decarboxylase subunit beta [Bacilliculturomica massiliensis]|uniref:siroheme decarboxylase subunit beta n=1 Tax=Bacilliculturomica massiliensis TaxID=1917867 RepID=UPI00102F7522|nr:Lrp/AsnC family transcriptional regulator [Bacilliculturomica massiliensis]